MSPLSKACAALLLILLCSGCGHTNVSKVALLSVGDLEYRTIPSKVEGPILVGKHTCKAGHLNYYLSEAVRNALQGTDYDTLIDAEITTRTGLAVWSNEIEVRGMALNSKVLPKDGGAK